MTKRIDQWRELVDEFKLNADVIHTIYLADNIEAMRILVVWPHQVVDVEEPVCAVPEDENRQWEWLWLSAKYDAKSLARAAGVHPALTREIMESLIGNRLIFPDGTVSTHAESTVKVYIGKKLKKGK
jgi:hypothetical protein